MFWDSELSGFGVRVYPSGSKYYVVQTRAGGAEAKRVTVGRHGVITPEEARRRTALIIAGIKAGEEPVPEPLALRLAHRAQRVTLRNPAFRRQVTEKAFLMNIRTTHLIQSFCDHSFNAHFTKLRSLSNQNMSFSTAC